MVYALQRVLACAALVTCTAAFAQQDYPNRNVRLVVGFAPGGSTDTTARIVGQRLQEGLGRTFVVDNRPGADGAIAAELVARSTADGYTIYVASNSITIAPVLYSKTPYDPVKDFTPISLVAAFPSLLIVHPSLNVNSVKELIALAKAKPGQLTFASSGAGTTPFMGMGLLMSMAGIKMVHVPFKGSAPAVAATLAGETQLMLGDLSTTTQHAKAGKVRALAVTSPRRLPLVPDVPTLSESGLTGFDTATWIGLLAPVGTPRAIVSRIAAEIGAYAQLPASKERFVSMGAELLGTTPEQFSERMKSDLAMWARVIKDTGMAGVTN
jgi:tripartite-type tricarboxylate transporter receptor subunit TctC